ncbi:hypothetical protein CS542_07310 [Pedobacter sp. IW39]|nr:hypothetical protein CS542_07310 [Pedobacter sp. IW39]
MIHIRTFRAPDDPEACSKLSATNALNLWHHSDYFTNRIVEDPKTMVILVEDKETKFVYGGARIQIKLISMIAFAAIGKYDENIRHDQCG